MSDEDIAIVPVSETSFTSVNSNSNSNSTTKAKLSLFRRIFDPEYPGAMERAQGNRERQQERARALPPPETQLVYGYWEPARAAAARTVESDRRLPYHAKTIGNLRDMAHSQADTASQADLSMTSNSPANTTMQSQQSDFSAAAADQSSLLNRRTRRNRASSDAAEPSHSPSESSTAVPATNVPHERQQRSKKLSTGSTVSSSGPSPQSSPDIGSSSPLTLNFASSLAGPSTSTPPNFELTPLSGLIKQSFKDIETLREAHKARLGSAHASDSGKVIDFDKVEENLKRFEELYRGFLRYGGAYGEKNEEVHLVAMVCKRSELINGKMASGEQVPFAKVPDCGY